MSEGGRGRGLRGKQVERRGVGVETEASGVRYPTVFVINYPRIYYGDRGIASSYPFHDRHGFVSEALPSW